MRRSVDWQLVLVALAIAFTNQSSSINQSHRQPRAAARPTWHEPTGCTRLNRQSSIVNRQFLPSQRTLLDAHNAYPDRGRFADRIDDALATGLPVAIEQDLAWCVSAGGTLAPLVSHESTCVGGEPTLETYFFERVRPIVEAALAKGPSADWPLITLNLDFKTNEPEHHAAVWALLGKYERWLTTAPRLADAAAVAPLQVGPLMVLTGSHDLQQATFHDAIPVGARLRVFGAIAGIAAPESNPSELPRATPGHQLPPLVESSVALGRGGRPARRGRLDAGRRRAPGGAGERRARPWTVDSVLHPQRRGRRARGLDRQLQLWQPRRRPRAAGAPPSTRRSISSPPISTRNLHDHASDPNLRNS